jgi:CPA2 family monovalent cation:H+ antiporter-2
MALEPQLATRPEAPGPPARAILIGFGLAGQQVARVLRARKVEVLAVEMNSSSVRAARSRGDHVIYGDATRRALLEQLGLSSARLVVIAVSDPIATREITNLVRALAPGLPIIARTRYVKEIDALEEAGASAVVAEEFESTLELVAETLRCFGVPDENITRFTSGLREEGYELMRGPAAQILDPWLAELLEQEGTEWLEVPESFEGEASLADLDLRGRTEVNVVAVERAGETTINPPASYALRRGDRLLALGSPEALIRLHALLEGRGS